MHDWLCPCYRSLCDHSLITNQTVIMQVINEEMAGLALLKLETTPPSIPSSTSLVKGCLEELSFLVVTGVHGQSSLSSHNARCFTCCQPRTYRSRLASIPCFLAPIAPVSIRNEREARGHVGLVKISQPLQTVALATQHVSQATVYTCGLT